MNKLKCEICGFEGMSLITHLKYKHFYTTTQYKQQFGECRLYIHSDELRKKISNTLKKLNEDPKVRFINSKKQKDGASCLTIKYWINRGLSEDKAKEKISELQKNNCKKHLEKNDLQECSQFNIKYWIKRGHSEENAKMEISKIQSKLSSRSSKFSGHTHTNEENERISSSVKKMIEYVGRGKWAKHFGNFNGRSKAEIEFYNYIKENVDSLVDANVPIGNYIVDVIKEKKIIEFYGDFWHANPSIFSEYEKLYPYGKSVMLAEEIWKRDKNRIDKLKYDGYEILIIWEDEWNKNKQECVDKIRKYLL